MGLPSGLPVPTLGTLWADCRGGHRAARRGALDPASGLPALAWTPTRRRVWRGACTGGKVIGATCRLTGRRPRRDRYHQVDHHRVVRARRHLPHIMANDADASHVAYYAAVRRIHPRARQLDGRNPGDDAAGLREPGRLCCGDFEILARGYFTRSRRNPGARAHPPRRFALRCSSRPADGMRATRSRARALGASWVSVHDTMPNRYDETPRYWNALVARGQTTFVRTDAVVAEPPRRAALVARAVARRVWFETRRGGVSASAVRKCSTQAAGMAQARSSGARRALTGRRRRMGRRHPSRARLRRPRQPRRYAMLIVPPTRAGAAFGERNLGARRRAVRGAGDQHIGEHHVDHPASAHEYAAHRLCPACRRAGTTAGA